VNHNTNQLLTTRAKNVKLCIRPKKGPKNQIENARSNYFKLLDQNLNEISY